jgi:hypothetical protein
LNRQALLGAKGSPPAEISWRHKPGFSCAEPGVTLALSRSVEETGAGRSSRLLKKSRTSLPIETKARLYVSESHARK